MTINDATVQPVVSGTDKSAEAFFALVEHFTIVSRWLGGNFADFYELGFALLFEEQEVATTANKRQFKDLDDRWNEWAGKLFRHLQNTRLDLDFSPDRDILKAFLRELTVNRVAIS